MTIIQNSIFSQCIYNLSGKFYFKNYLLTPFLFNTKYFKNYSNIYRYVRNVSQLKCIWSVEKSVAILFERKSSKYIESSM